MVVCVLVYLLTVSEELVQLVRSCEHLRSGLHELQKIRPGLVQSVFPLGDGGSIRVTAVNHLIHHLIDRIHLFLTHCTCLRGEPSKAALQNLRKLNNTKTTCQR